MDATSIYNLVRANAEKAKNANNLSEFLALIGERPREVTNYQERAFLTFSLHPETSNYTRALTLPKARKFSDLFTAAKFGDFVVGTPSKQDGTRHDYGDSFYYIGGTRCSPQIVPFGHVGGTRYAVVHKDGSAHRGCKGSKWSVSAVKPNTELARHLGAARWSFNVVEQPNGALLVTVSNMDYVGEEWLAILDAGQSLLELMPEAQVQAWTDHVAQKQADYACFYTGEDGREYIDEQKCKIEIVRR